MRARALFETDGSKSNVRSMYRTRAWLGSARLPCVHRAAERSVFGLELPYAMPVPARGVRKAPEDSGRLEEAKMVERVLDGAAEGHNQGVGQLFQLRR